MGFGKAKAILAVAFVATLAALGGCSSGGTAATVEGVAIPEQAITMRVELMRDSMDLIDDVLVINHAGELGVEVPAADIDEMVESFKSQFETDAEWQEYLDNMSGSEVEYRADLERALYDQAINEYFKDKAETTDEEIDNAKASFVEMYAGNKRVSRISISIADVQDEDAINEAIAAAQGVRSEIESGILTFDEAYERNAEPAALGADVGWEMYTGFDEAYVRALQSMGVGDISEPLVLADSVDIITVTDMVPADADGALSDEVESQIEDQARTMAGYRDYMKWVENLHANAEIKINPMPSGLPYAL